MIPAASPRIRVKICGMTNVPDAVHAAAAGADALGFIFAAGSKRLVDPATARAASLAVGPGVARIGVFLNQPLDEVLRLAEATRMTALQLHGEVPEPYLKAATAHYPVLLALHSAQLMGRTVAEVSPGHAPTLLVDAPVPGSGQPLDWEALRPVFPAGAWLAGGLGPHNVRAAIAALRPAGVDAVTQLELSPGQKNPQAVQAFIDAVQGF